MAKRASTMGAQGPSPLALVAALTAVHQYICDEVVGEGGPDEELAAALAATLHRLRRGRRVSDA